MPPKRSRECTEAGDVAGAVGGSRARARARGLFIALAAGAALLPSVAQAAPTLSVSPTLPGVVTVGQTVPASFTLTNDSTAEDPGLTICRSGSGGACTGAQGIVLTPSCGGDVGTACGVADAGVFTIDTLATGGSGCHDVTFLATPLNDAYGRVGFEPTGGLTISLARGEACRVDFSFTVRRLPAIDSRPSLGGVQTAAIVTAEAVSFLNAPVSGGSSALLTVEPAPAGPPPPTPPAPPAVPTVNDIDPDGPANENLVMVKGAAAPGTTVNVYGGPSCAGAPVSQGGAAAFAAPGLPARVADDTVSSFSATATDPVSGLTSGCSTTSRNYVEDSSPPETTIDTGPAGGTDDETPSFTFSSSETGSASCRIDGAAFTVCVSPFTPVALAAGAHTFQVRAADVAGNVDPSPATRSFTVGTSFRPASLPGCSLKGNTITGTPDNDALRGTAKTDIIVGLASSDLLRGVGGRDCLFGSGGTDRLLGGPGADLLFGGADNDILNGEAGNDQVNGERGLDRIDGGSGNDAITGGDGPDRITDRRGTDRVAGGAGNERIDARDLLPLDRRGRDRISCGAGTDRVFADPSDVVARDCELITKRSL